MFYQCRSLKNVVIPEGVTSIGYQAFMDCDNLTSITIPRTVRSIGHFALSYCDSLSEVHFLDGITSIGEEVLQMNPNLTNIMIPASVTSIGSNNVFPAGVTINIYTPQVHMQRLTLRKKHWIVRMMQRGKRFPVIIIL